MCIKKIPFCLKLTCVAAVDWVHFVSHHNILNQSCHNLCWKNRQADRKVRCCWYIDISRYDENKRNLWGNRTENIEICVGEVDELADLNLKQSRKAFIECKPSQKLVMHACANYCYPKVSGCVLEEYDFLYRIICLVVIICVRAGWDRSFGFRSDTRPRSSPFSRDRVSRPRRW